MPIAKKTTKSASVKVKEVASSPYPFKLELLSKKTKRMLVAVVVIVLIGVVLFVNRSLFVAATVNGQSISRLSIVQELEKQYGGEVLKRLIDRSLILTEGQKMKIDVEDKDVSDKRKEIVDRESGGDEKKFEEILKSLGLTNEKFLEELRLQVLLEKIIGDKADVSDKEFEDFLAANPDLIANAEDEEEAKKQLRAQLKQQKLQSEYAVLLERLNKEGEVVRFVNY